MFFYDSAMDGFWWTTSAIYPSLYSFKDSAWLWYSPGAKAPRAFYNFANGNWIYRP
jgi:hypothetical protein